MLFAQSGLLLTISFCVSFLICIAIVRTQSLHGRWSHDSRIGVQKIHSDPTPRIGGVGVFLALLTIYVTTTFMKDSGAGDADLQILEALLLGGGICFVVRLAEDITKRVSVTMRLIACLVAASGAIAFSDAAILRVGLPPIDSLLTWMPAWSVPYAPFAVVFTFIAVAGVANAFNIVDGFNGLSSGIAMVVCVGIAAIALEVGDTNLAGVASLLVAAMLGFWLINWPYGKIFLGDGGAYFIGFCVAWLVVLLPFRNPIVSPWASLLLISYPVTEVMHSIVRRSRRSGHHPGAPDKVHMHHLVHARFVRKYFSRSAPHAMSHLSNGMTGVVVCVANGFIVAVGYTFFNSQIILMAAFALVLIAFGVIYRKLALFRC